MANISKIGTTLKETLLYKPVNWLGKTNLVKNRLGKQYQLNNDKLITGVGVFSVVAKDGVNCALYTTQSLHNENIPEDKRPFVAALDLTNGILMMTTQVAMTIGFAKIQNKMFNKTFGKYFDRAAAKGYQRILSKTNDFKGIGGDQFHPAFDKYKGTVTSAFNQITSLVVATIVAKRMIVPFLSTPLADTAKKWMMKNDKNENNTHPETKNSFDTEKTVKVKDVSTFKASEKAEKTEDKKVAQQPENNKPQTNNLVANYVKSHQ